MLFEISFVISAAKLIQSLVKVIMAMQRVSVLVENKVNLKMQLCFLKFRELQQNPTQKAYAPSRAIIMTRLKVLIEQLWKN